VLLPVRFLDYGSHDRLEVKGNEPPRQRLGLSHVRSSVRWITSGVDAIVVDANGCARTSENAVNIVRPEVRNPRSETSQQLRACEAIRGVGKRCQQEVRFRCHGLSG